MLFFKSSTGGSVRHMAEREERSSADANVKL